MSQISKVDKILQEIYLEMEMEEIDEFIVEMDAAHLSEEGEARAMGRMSLAQIRKLRAGVEKAKASGDSELVRKATQALNRAKFKWSRFKASSGASDVITGAKKGATKAVAKGQEIAASAGKAIKGGAEKTMGSDVGKTVKKGVEGAVKKGGELAGQAKGLVSANPEAAAAAAAVAAVAAGVVIYKKFFSQAARACRGKSGSDKSNCVASFKVKGLQAAKSKVSAGMAKCKSPKCKAKLQSKIQGFDAKISAMKGKVSEAVIDEYVGDFMSEVFEQDSKN